MGRLVAVGRNPLVIPPPVVAGLVLWFDAAYGVAVSGGVVQWNDKSASGFHVVQATASAQPSYKGSDANLHSQPSLGFSSSALNNTTNTPFVQSSARSIFAVVRAGAIGGTVIDCKRGNPDSAYQWADLGLRYVWSDSSTNLYITSPPTLANTSYYLTWINPGTGGTFVFRANGIGYTIVGSSIPAETAGAGFAIGTRTAFGQSFDGAIAELLCYNTALSNADRDIVELYLKNKYRL